MHPGKMILRREHAHGLRDPIEDSEGFWLDVPKSGESYARRADAYVGYHPYAIPEQLRAENADWNNQPRRTYFIHDRALRQDSEGEQARWLLYLSGARGMAIRIVPGGEVFGGEFWLLEFYNDQPIVYVPGHNVGLLVRDTELVLDYRTLIARITGNALDAHATRERLTEIADLSVAGDTSAGVGDGPQEAA